MNRIIALWCHPRSLSTAFERMVIERGDLEVIHEPFLYLYYVVQNPHLVIARQEPEILPHMSRSFDEIVAGAPGVPDRALNATSPGPGRSRS